MLFSYVNHMQNLYGKNHCLHRGYEQTMIGFFQKKAPENQPDNSAKYCAMKHSRAKQAAIALQHGPNVR